MLHYPSFFFDLFLIIIALSLQTIEANWRCGRHNLQRIQCRSENSKGVYCLQYDDDKIISGLRDNSIKVCVHPTPRDSLHLDADCIGDEVPCTRLHNIWLLFSMALLCSKGNSHYSCYYYTDCFFEWNQTLSKQLQDAAYHCLLHGDQIFFSFAALSTFLINWKKDH